MRFCNFFYFYFRPYGFDYLGFFDKRPQGCHEVKNSMGLLQGPRMMAWTTKSPILENHWVPWGCRAHLGSVKMFDHLKGKIMKADQHGLRSLTKKYFFFVFFHQSKSYVTFLSKLNRWNLIKTSPVQIIMTHPLYSIDDSSLWN